MFGLVSAKVVRYPLVPLLSLWIAGTACLFGCEMRVNAATSVPAGVSDSEVVVVRESCASADSHECCAKKQVTRTEEAQNTNEDSSPFETVDDGSSGSMRECPLAINATAIITKVGQEQTTEVFPLTPIAAVLPQSLQYQSALIEPLRVPNRGHTYLRCCTFLI